MIKCKFTLNSWCDEESYHMLNAYLNNTLFNLPCKPDVWDDIDLYSWLNESDNKTEQLFEILQNHTLIVVRTTIMKNSILIYLSPDEYCHRDIVSWRSKNSDEKD